MHDFATNRRLDRPSEPFLETNWAPDLPSIILGLILGSVLAIVAYKVNVLQESAVETPSQVTEESEPTVDFQFYNELKKDDLYPAFSAEN